MKCEEIGELLPDYLQGSLKAEQDELVEKHMERVRGLPRGRGDLEEAVAAAGGAAERGVARAVRSDAAGVPDGAER